MNGKPVIIKEKLYLRKMIVLFAFTLSKTSSKLGKGKYIYIFLLDFKTSRINFYNERNTLKNINHNSIKTMQWILFFNFFFKLCNARSEQAVFFHLVVSKQDSSLASKKMVRKVACLWV